MIEGGWLKLYRKMESWEWFGDSYTFHVFMFLLIRAKVGDEPWQGMIIHRGQCVVTRKIISATTGIPERSVYRSLKKLQSTGEIKMDADNKRTVVTICKFDSYNPSKIDIRTTDDITDGTTDGTTYKEVKEIKEYIKEKDISKDISKKKIESVPDDLLFLGDNPQSSTTSTVTPEELVSLWNSGRGNCPKVIKLSEKRKVKAKARLAEFGKTREEQMATIENLMRCIRESDFLQYQWTCNFQWLVENSDNWVKVIEGNYRNKKQTHRNTSQDRMDKFANELKKLDDIFNDGAEDTDLPDEQ